MSTTSILQEEKKSSEKSVSSTDILARQSGDFEKYKVTSAVTTDVDSILSKENINITKPTQSRYLILELEPVDGNTITATLQTERMIFSNQTHTVKQIIKNGYAYVYDEDNLVLTTSREKATKATEEYDLNSTVTFSDLMKEMFDIMVQNWQIKLGFRSYRTAEQERSDIIQASKKEFSCNIPDCNNINKYISFLTHMPENPVEAEILKFKSDNCMTVLIKGQKYDIYFDGRPTNDEHTPTALARKLGVRIPENLENETIMIGIERYFRMNSKMDPVGKNKSKVLSLGV